MKKKGNEGFTLLETLIAIVVLGIVVVPTCSSLIMSFRINAKADQLLRDQLAVSSVVETLMAEGIRDDENSKERYKAAGINVCNNPNCDIENCDGDDCLKNPEWQPLPYYKVTVTVGDVSVTTQIRAYKDGGAG